MIEINMVRFKASFINKHKHVVYTITNQCIHSVMLQVTYVRKYKIQAVKILNLFTGTHIRVEIFILLYEQIVVSAGYVMCILRVRKMILDYNVGGFYVCCKGATLKRSTCMGR